jgi:hypothetical protein
MKRLFILLVLLLLNACAHQYHSKGTLTTVDKRPLLIQQGANKIALSPGYASIDFSDRPVFLGNFNLMTANGKLEISTHPENYQSTSLRLLPQNNEINLIIQANWGRQEHGSSSKEDTEDCTKHGYCSKSISFLKCPNGNTYYEKGSGSSTYNDRKYAKENNCTYDSKYESGNYDDCPGTRKVLKHYKDFYYAVKADFIDPNKNSTLATFKGDSENESELSNTENIGECQLR